MLLARAMHLRADREPTNLANCDVLRYTEGMTAEFCAK